MVEDSSAAAPSGSPEFDDVYVPTLLARLAETDSPVLSVITINIMDGVVANSGGQNPPIPPYNLLNIQGDIL